MTALQNYCLLHLAVVLSALPQKASARFTCSSNHDCSFKGTCLADAKVCSCEVGRVGDDCSISAAILSPVRAISASTNAKDSLKLVSAPTGDEDIEISNQPARHEEQRCYVLYDLSQARGELASAYLYLARARIPYGSFGIEVAMVPDITWSASTQNGNAPPTAGTMPGGTLTYPGRLHCDLSDWPRTICNPFPKVDVTKYVLEAMAGLKKIAFRLRLLEASGLYPTVSHIVLELRGMRKLATSPGYTSGGSSMGSSASSDFMAAPSNDWGASLRTESCSAWGGDAALVDLPLKICEDVAHALGGRSCLPGITEMSLGYDVVKGTTRAPVFKFTLSSSGPRLFSTSYVLPDQLHATALDESTVSTAGAIYSSMKEVYDATSTRLGLQGKSKKGAFKGGFGYAEARKSLVNEKSEFLEIVRTRSYFKIAQATTETALPQQFVTAVDALPPEYTPTNYAHFLATFGTHYTQGATLGGRVATTISVDRCYSSLHTRQEIETQGQAVHKAGIGLSYKYESTKTKIEERFWERSRTSIIVSGGQTSEMCCKACTYDDWKETILSAPVPVTRTVSPIYFLVARIDPSKAEHIKTAVQAYIDANPITPEDEVNVRDSAMASADQCTVSAAREAVCWSVSVFAIAAAVAAEAFA